MTDTLLVVGQRWEALRDIEAHPDHPLIPNKP